MALRTKIPESLGGESHTRASTNFDQGSHTSIGRVHAIATVIGIAMRGSFLHRRFRR
jgi:hypothetical protein